MENRGAHEVSETAITAVGVLVNLSKFSQYKYYLLLFIEVLKQYHSVRQIWKGRKDQKAGFFLQSNATRKLRIPILPCM